MQGQILKHVKDKNGPKQTCMAETHTTPQNTTHIHTRTSKARDSSLARTYHQAC